MNRHLSEDEISEWMLLHPSTRDRGAAWGPLGSSERELAEHLHTCATCTAETAGLRDAISGYRDAVTTAAEHDSNFWARQRIAIGERIRPRGYSPLLRWAVNAVAVLVLLAAFLLVRTPQPVQRAGNEFNDDVLLQQVGSDIERDYPVALAPAALIDQERNLALSNGGSIPLTSLDEKEQQQ